ncbi:MAG: hypothetical protein M3Q31_10585, partial [Actinomycetota bacterium]|nr:hypothetical protein [Actinomycetota bacterium]
MADGPRYAPLGSAGALTNIVWIRTFGEGSLAGLDSTVVRMAAEPDSEFASFETTAGAAVGLATRTATAWLDVTSHAVAVGAQYWQR